MEVYCINCRECIQVEVWEDGKCPGCNEPYSWDCGYSHKEDDEYIYVVWENY